MGLDIFYTSNANVASFGGRGIKVLADGESLASGDECYAVLALDNTTLLADLTNDLGDSTLSTTLFAGIMVYSNFSNVQVLTGNLLCYLK